MCQTRVTLRGAHLRYAERGGGTFATLTTANDRKAALLHRHKDAEVKVFVTDCDWTEVDANVVP